MDEESIIPTPEAFLFLFSVLRGSDGDMIAESSRRLEKLYRIPDSLQCLLQLIQECSDEIMQQYSLYGLRDCLRKTHEKQSSTMIEECEKVVASLLKIEHPFCVLSALLEVAATLTLVSRAFWSVLVEFLFGPDSTPRNAIPILTRLLFMLEVSVVSENLGRFLQLVKDGLSSRDARTIANALELLFALANHLYNNRTDMFAPFVEPLQIILRKVAVCGDTNYLNKVLSPFVSSFEKKYSLIPFPGVYFEFMPLLVKHQFCIEYKLHLHNFLANFLTISKEATFQSEMTLKLLDIELKLCCEFCTYEDFDPTLNWFYDFDLMIRELFFRLTSQQIMEYTATRIKALSEMRTDESRSTMILLFGNAIFCAPDVVNEQLVSFFGNLLDGLNSDSSIVSRMASRLIEDNAAVLSEVMSSNVDDLIPAIISFIRAGNQIEGSILLVTVLNHVDNTDTVIESSLAFVYEMCQSNDINLSFMGFRSLVALIQKSYEFVSANASQLFQLLLANIPVVNEATAPILKCLATIGEQFPDLLIPSIPHILDLTLETQTNDNAFMLLEIVSFYDSIAASMDELLKPYAQPIFDFLLKLTDRNWHIYLSEAARAGDFAPKLFEMACTAYEAMAKYALITDNPELISTVFCRVAKLLGTNNPTGKSSSLNVFCYFLGSVPPSILEDSMGNIEIILNQCFHLLCCDPFSSADCLIGIHSAVCVFGAPIIEEKCAFIQSLLLDYIQSEVNLYTQEPVFNPDIHDTSLYCPILVDVCLLDTNGVFLRKIVSLLWDLFAFDQPSCLSFAIGVFSSLLQFEQFFENGFILRLFEKCLSLLENSAQSTTIASVCLFSDVLEFGYGRNILDSKVGDLMSIANSKLENVSSRVLIPLMRLNALLILDALKYSAELAYGDILENFLNQDISFRHSTVTTVCFNAVITARELLDTQLLSLAIRWFVSFFSQPDVVLRLYESESLKEYAMFLKSMLDLLENPDETIQALLSPFGLAQFHKASQLYGI